MVTLPTPVCEFGKSAPDFDLGGVDGQVLVIARLPGAQRIGGNVYQQSLSVCDGHPAQTRPRRSCPGRTGRVLCGHHAQ